MTYEERLAIEARKLKEQLTQVSGIYGLAEAIEKLIDLKVQYERDYHERWRHT